MFKFDARLRVRVLRHDADGVNDFLVRSGAARITFLRASAISMAPACDNTAPPSWRFGHRDAFGGDAAALAKPPPAQASQAHRRAGP